MNLIEHVNHFSGKKIPTKYRNALESREEGIKVTNASSRLVFGSWFVSGLGMECRNIVRYESLGSSSSKHIACAYKKLYEEQNRVWYLVPSVDSESSDIDF